MLFLLFYKVQQLLHSPITRRKLSHRIWTLSRPSLCSYGSFALHLPVKRPHFAPVNSSSAFHLSPISSFYSTAGFAKDDNLDLGRGLVTRCPISIPRPAMKTRRKTPPGSFDKIFKKKFFLLLEASASGNCGPEKKGGIFHFLPKISAVVGCGIQCRY